MITKLKGTRLIDTGFKLSVVSIGGGQDSLTFGHKIIHDPEFRAKHAPGHIVMVMADTGGEHPETYATVLRFAGECQNAGIPFRLITTNLERVEEWQNAGLGDSVVTGYHTAAWPNVWAPQSRPEGSPFKETMIQNGTKGCVRKLKLDPLYKWLDDYINELMDYGYKTAKTLGCNKQAMKRFRDDHGKIRVLIGFAKGEEGRAERATKRQAGFADLPGQWESTTDQFFPLIEEGLDRAACRKYLDSHGWNVMPSNCMSCPYQNAAELLWLSVTHPTVWNWWVNVEQRKLARSEGAEKNYGVYCDGVTLEKRLIKAREKFGHLSPEALLEHKMTHGCQTGF